jgi:hypothetical protein
MKRNCGGRNASPVAKGFPQNLNIPGKFPSSRKKVPLFAMPATAENCGRRRMVAAQNLLDEQCKIFF